MIKYNRVVLIIGVYEVRGSIKGTGEVEMELCEFNISDGGGGVGYYLFLCIDARVW